METALICLAGALVATYLGGSAVNLYLATFTARLKAAHEKNAGSPDRGFPEGESSSDNSNGS
jgi:hypothetical protein